MKYVSEIIGEDEFTSWGPGQRVFITAATGTGKTTFILNKLLMDRAIEKREKILYIVNRKILKEQIENQINNTVFNMARNKYGNMINIIDHIWVTTYQSIENKIQYDLQNLWNCFNNFDIVIYDECHYFYMDSNFNTHTELSYDCLRHFFDKKIQIFISATMKKIRSYIDKYDDYYFLKEIEQIKWNGTTPTFPMYKQTERNVKDKEFFIDQDYSYVNINIFDTYEDLIDRVIEDMKRKWLIFVDNIEKGKNLQKQISEKIKEKTSNKTNVNNGILLIDARFRNQEDSNKAVKDIVKYEKIINKRIIIATSVMDNGISLIDDELRDIVIFYDTEEEFIQMLGRKRYDESDINLYICKRDSNHFRLRLHGIRKILDFYNRHRKSIEQMYKRFIYNYNYPCPYDCQMKCKKSCISYCVFPIECYNDCRKTCSISCRINCEDNCQKNCKNIFDVTPYFDLYMSKFFPGYINQYQCLLLNMLSFQQIVLDDILDKRFSNQILYSLNGFIAVNFFSINRIIDLDRFYSDMKDKIENDEYAFVKEQMRWLGIEDDKIYDNIMNRGKGLNEEHKNTLQENIEKLLNKEFGKKENIALKTKVNNALIHFLISNEGDQNMVQQCKKNDRPISENIFNRCMEISGLPYKMTKPNGSTFLIEKRAENMG